MKTIIAVAQMSSRSNKAENLKEINMLANSSSEAGASLLCLPENCVFMGSALEVLQAAESLDGPSIANLKEVARQNKIWLSIGGFQEHIPGKYKIFNTHIILDQRGNIAAFYRKMHLFSVRLPTGELYEESKSVLSGNELITFQAPAFVGGLSICYDLRFPYLFWALREKGAEVLLIPAAFTATTGKAHWEILLRARAIETQSYVLAAAQIGENVPGRFTHGHAMIIDPWGLVMAECSDNEKIIVAEIDTSVVEKLRREMPLDLHRVASISIMHNARLKSS